MKDIEIIDIDYSAAQTSYRIKEEHVLANCPLPWLVPDKGPFYTNNIRLYNGGTPLVYDKDYTFDTPAPQLTELTGHDVYHFIVLKDHIVTSAVKINIEYQNVGKPMLGRKELLQMLEEMVIEGKPIDFTTSVIGIPKTFPSSKHSMDVTKKEEVIGFGSLMQLFIILSGRVKGGGTEIKDRLEKIQNDFFTNLDYIQNLQWSAVMNHATKTPNPHGIKPSDVDLGNVANNKTASLQQEIEGARTDLYSTPRGFAEIIKNAEPDSEEFVFQNELPFSYYGSGIYLPPPISGSFEGLGGDFENGCFVQEGNGWVVGLQRCFDGRVRNLYYIYDQSLSDNPSLANWKQTYVKYTHSLITAAGCDANVVMSGSGWDVLCVGDDSKNRWWICDPNSSLDSSQHQYKEIDMSEVFRRTSGTYYAVRASNVWRAGDYFYLMMFNGEGGRNSDNHSGWIYRIAIADVLNPLTPNVKWMPVNITYDNLKRVRKTNQPAFVMDEWYTNAAGTRYTGGMGVNFSHEAINILTHRRRMIMTCPNPNDPAIVSFRVHWLVWAVFQIGAAQFPRQWFLIADYTFNSRTNTLDLDPAWSYVSVDVPNGTMLISDEVARRQNGAYPPGLKVNCTTASTCTCFSRIPGYGPFIIGSHQDGGAPYIAMKTLENPSRNPARDYEFSKKPANSSVLGGTNNDGSTYIIPDTPFGFSSYPRWYSDVYFYNGVNHATPLELFMADSPGKDAFWFYREVEPGDGAKFIPRPEAQLLSGATPLMREMNTKFGQTNIIANVIGKVNNPKSKDQYSTEYGYLSVRWAAKQLGGQPLISHIINEQGIVARPVVDTQGGIIIPLLCDHTLNNGVLMIKPSLKAYVPAYVWRDWPARLLGAEINNVMDMSLDIWFSPKPDGTPGRRASYAMLTFHTTDRQKDVRQIVSKFTWESRVTRPDGALTIGISSEQYPFKSDYTGDILAPGTTNRLLAAGGDDLTYNSNGNWVFINPGALSTPSMQVLEAKEHHIDAFSLKAYTGWRLQTTGYSRIFTIRDGWDPGYYNDGTWSGSPHTGAYVGYDSYHVANPEHGFCRGVNMPSIGGGAMNYTYRPDNTPVLIGATFSIGNWSVFINSEVNVTFNGYSMVAAKRNFDLRDFSENYKDSVFYIYCVGRGSKAEYEITKLLRNSRGDSLLICKVTTGAQGIRLIERYQPFSIAGSPVTQVRDAGIPATTGALTEAGNYPHIKRSELYKG